MLVNTLHLVVVQMMLSQEAHAPRTLLQTTGERWLHPDKYSHRVANLDMGGRKNGLVGMTCSWQKMTDAGKGDQQDEPAIGIQCSYVFLATQNRRDVEQCRKCTQELREQS